jgi:hypothetical protein
MPAVPDQIAQDTAGRNAEVIEALMRTCDELKADHTERLALFQAAIVASNLRADYQDGDRLGVLGQNSFWGAAAARRDARIATEVFLREARRLREVGEAPRSASRLAARVQGDSSVLRYRLAARTAQRILAETDTTQAAPVATAPVAAVAAEA